jgi:hypothetical protein
MRAKRAIIASQRARRNARLAQIPRLRKERLLGMTNHNYGYFRIGVSESEMV